MKLQLKKKSGDLFTQSEVDQLVDDSQSKTMLEAENSLLRDKANRLEEVERAFQN